MTINSVKVYKNTSEGFSSYLREVILNKTYFAQKEVHFQANEELVVSYQNSKNELIQFQLDKGVFNGVEQKVELPFQLMLQLDSKEITLTLPERHYHFKMKPISRMDKSFFDNLLRKPPKWQKSFVEDYEWRDKCFGYFVGEKKVLKSSSVDLTRFISNFNNFEDWLVNQLKSAVKEDLKQILKNKMASSRGVKIEPIQDFSVKII